MEAQQIAPINLEPQLAPAEQRHRKHLEEGCDHLSSAGHWLSESESAYNDLEQARVAYDERVKSLIQNDPKALELDPNQVATVMRIESCGHPEVNSSAGAEGLFQVMPFLFRDDERDRMTDPATNVKRGLWDLSRCLENASGMISQALAR